MTRHRATRDPSRLLLTLPGSGRRRLAYFPPAMVTPPGQAGRGLLHSAGEGRHAGSADREGLPDGPGCSGQRGDISVKDGYCMRRVGSSCV